MINPFVCSLEPTLRWILKAVVMEWCTTKIGGGPGLLENSEVHFFFMVCSFPAFPVFGMHVRPAV